MATNTTNYNLIKPGVNDPTDQDLWGGYLNENFDTIDTVMKDNSLSPLGSVLTTNYVLQTTDNNKVFLMNTTSGSLSFTLGAASGFEDGFKVSFKKLGAANALNVIGTVDGITNPSVTEENKLLTVSSDNTNWYFTGDFTPFTSGTETIVQRKVIQSSTTAALSSTTYSDVGISFELDNDLADAANKVRITVYAHAGVGANMGNSLYFTIKTGSTDLAGAFSGLAGLLCDSPNGPTEASAMDSFTMFAERTPGVVAKETYRIQARADYTATDFYFGRNAANNRTLPTTIIIEEVQVN